MHGFQDRKTTAGEARALPGREPDVAVAAFLGEPDAAFIARDFESARRFQAQDLTRGEVEPDALRAELHSAYWLTAMPWRAMARASATQAVPMTARTMGKRREFM